VAVVAVVAVEVATLSFGVAVLAVLAAPVGVLAALEEGMVLPAAAFPKVS
jgi:hypothetical protein